MSFHGFKPALSDSEILELLTKSIENIPKVPDELIEVFFGVVDVAFRVLADLAQEQLLETCLQRVPPTLLIGLQEVAVAVGGDFLQDCHGVVLVAPLTGGS